MNWDFLKQVNVFWMKSDVVYDAFYCSLFFRQVCDDDEGHTRRKKKQKGELVHWQREHS